MDAAKLAIHSLVDGDIGWFLAIKLLGTFKYKSPCGYVFLFLLGKYPEWNSGSYEKYVLRSIRNYQNVFPEWLYPFTFPPAMGESSLCIAFSPTCPSFHLSHSSVW